ncbi:hypothetical protein AB5N19_07899 [Seiridium cardinale]
MFSTPITLKAILLASLAATTQAAAITPSEKPGKRGISGNNASILTCFTLNDGQCGMTASYTNGEKRQTVSFTNASPVGCTVAMLKKQTNDEGFWVDVDLFGSTPGGNIGWNPSGEEIELGKASSSNEDPDYISKRCSEEFTWTKTVDTSKSGENYWNDLDKKLY